MSKETVIPEQFKEIEVNIDFFTFDDALEDDPGETIHSTEKASELFTPEQLVFIASRLKPGEEPVGIGVDTGYGRDASVFLTVKKDGEMSGRLLYEGSMPQEGLSGIRFPEHPKSHVDRRQEIHEKMMGKIQVEEEQPVDILPGFLKKDDLVILRAGTYVPGNYVYGVMYPEPINLPYQTMLLPMTKGVIKRLLQTPLTTEVVKRSSDRKPKDVVDIRFSEAQELVKFLNENLKYQQLKARLANEQQVAVFMCDHEYSKTRLEKALLCDRPLASTVRKDGAITYLNVNAGAGIGVTGGIYFYTEESDSPIFQAILEIVPIDAGEQPESKRNVSTIFGS